MGVTRHQLANGLRVVLDRDASLPLVAVNLWYHVGSRHERPGRTGLAHLFEHMLFQGSRNVAANQHFEYVQQVGGVANGSTFYDRTNYYETLPAAHLDLGLWLESDRMGYLLDALTPEKLETQRGVVMNERRQRVDNQPYGRAFERLHEMLYPEGHPYRWPVIGYMDDIAAATLDDVTGFFRAHYSPDNAVLCLAGDFDPERALGRIEHFFGPIPGGGNRGNGGAAPDAPTTASHETMTDRVALPRLYLAFRGPGYGQPGWHAGELLTLALAGGKASLLHHDLVYQRELAQDVGAGALPTELESTFVVVVTARPETDLEELEGAVDAWLERARREPLEADELDRAQQIVLHALTGRLQTTGDRADLRSMFATYFDDPGRLEGEGKRYRICDAEAVRQFAHEVLAPEGRASLWVVPEPGT